MPDIMLGQSSPPMGYNPTEEGVIIDRRAGRHFPLRLFPIAPPTTAR